MKGWRKAAIAALVALLLLAAIPPLLPKPVGAGLYASTYNFVDITSPSSAHQTWSGNLTIDPLTDPPPSYAEGTYANEINERKGPGSGYSALEVDDAGYNAIEASDDSRYATEIPAGTDNTALWHEFKITEDPLSVTRIDIKWEGYQGNSSPGTKLWVMIWNYEYGVYHVLDVSAQTSDYEYTGSITSNCDHFVSSGDIITVLAYNDISDDEIYCDYVEVVITYESTFISGLNTFLTGWGWSPDEQRGIGNVSFPVTVSQTPRANSTEVRDIRFIGTLNLTYTDTTVRTFALNLTGVRTRSLFYLRQHEVDINGSVWESSWRGTWLTWNDSGVEKHYISSQGDIMLPYGDVWTTVNPYFFLLRTPDADFPLLVQPDGDFAETMEYIIGFGVRVFDELLTDLSAIGFWDMLGDVLDRMTVMIKEVRDRLVPYIP